MTVVRNVSSGPNDVENLLWLPPLGTQKNAVTSSRNIEVVDFNVDQSSLLLSSVSQSAFTG